MHLVLPSNIHPSNSLRVSHTPSPDLSPKPNDFWQRKDLVNGVEERLTDVAQLRGIGGLYHDAEVVHIHLQCAHKSSWCAFLRPVLPLGRRQHPILQRVWQQQTQRL